MRTLLPLALPILLASTPAFAALATDAGTALQFFRNKDSAFPSGQASRTILENKLLRTQTESSYHVRWDHREFDLQGNQILRDIETARFVDTKAVSQLLSLNRADASPVKTVGAGTTLEIVDTDIYWARVKTRDGKVEGWLPISMLKNRHDDTGVFVNIVDTFLRKEASASSSVITTVPRLRRVLPIAFEKGFMKIQYKGVIGYVDVNYFVSRADFASLVYVAGKNWVPTTHRNGENIVTSLREEVPLKNILGYVTSPLRGIVVRPNKSSGPLLLSRVEIIKPEASTWAVSRIDGHGEVWWKRSTITLNEATPK
ncbi:MAG: hypothetical protein J7501_11150, partial [Bdellovibrio sp.]|nr:hypothetical protein [Bdellovibrio sp.]